MIAEGRKMRFSALLSSLSVAIALALVSPSGAAPFDEGAAYGSELQGFDYPWPVLHFRFTSQGEALDMAYMDVKTGEAEPARRGAAARQEFLRGHLARHHRGIEPGRLSRDRPGPDRILQIDQARALPIQFPSARGEYAHATGLDRNKPSNLHRSFDGQNARNSR